MTRRAPAAARPGRRLALAHDMPLEVNNQVQYMLEVYKGRLKDEITPAFERSGRYLPLIQEIFRAGGRTAGPRLAGAGRERLQAARLLPAAAKGLWQFIRSTGRLYGLESDYWIDERCDPEKATRAAARHLKDLHDHYDDWYLALAAYNAGAGKVDHAIRHGRPAATTGRSPPPATCEAETKNYVPAYLATLLIAEDPAKHGFDFTPSRPGRFERVDVEGPADLARARGVRRDHRGGAARAQPGAPPRHHSRQPVDLRAAPSGREPGALPRGLRAGPGGGTAALRRAPRRAWRVAARGSPRRYGVRSSRCSPPTGSTAAPRAGGTGAPRPALGRRLPAGGLARRGGRRRRRAAPAPAAPSTSSAVARRWSRSRPATGSRSPAPAHERDPLRWIAAGRLASPGPARPRRERCAAGAGDAPRPARRDAGAPSPAATA